MANRCLWLVGLFWFYSSAVSADSLLADAALAMSGNWSGELTYRDYRSDQRVAIPHERSIAVDPAGAFATHQNVFTDPGYKVYSAELHKFDAQRLTVASTSDQGINVEEFAIVSIEKNDEVWQLQAEGNAFDNGQPAQIRIRLSVDAQTMAIERSARQAGEAEFRFRNAVNLTRVE